MQIAKANHPAAITKEDTEGVRNHESSRSRRQIDIAEVQARLPQLLDNAESGEMLVITRNGKPVAQLAPVSKHDRARVRCVLEKIAALGRTTSRMTLDEVLSARREGLNR